MLEVPPRNNSPIDLLWRPLEGFPLHVPNLFHPNPIQNPARILVDSWPGSSFLMVSQKECGGIGILCVKEENVGKLAEVDEEGVEDPEEGEVSPVGVFVVEEVEEESMNLRADVDKW